MSHPLTATVSGMAFAALAVSPALAGPTFTNGSGGTFEYYGHLNPAYVNFDDGQGTFGEVGDNSRSSSRFGFNIRQPFDDTTFRFRFETALGFNGTSSFTQEGRGRVYDWTRSDLRHVDFQLITANAGTIYAGQGSMVGDGLGEYDFAGTDLTSGLGLTDVAGGYLLRRTGDTGAIPSSGVEIGDAFDNFDGSRRGRIRYDSPDLNGFRVGASWGQNILSSSDDDTYYDVGAWFENEFDGVEVAGGLAYQWRDRDDAARDDVETFIASGAVLLDNGLSLSLAYGNEQDGGSYYYTRLGFQRAFLAVGDTALSVDFYSGGDLVSEGDDSTAWGLGATQTFDALSLEAYLGYYSYAYDDAAGSFDDARSWIVGARWRF